VSNKRFTRPLVDGPPLNLKAGRFDAPAPEELFPTDDLYALAAWVSTTMRQPFRRMSAEVSS
jgi:hypothetical protein